MGTTQRIIPGVTGQPNWADLSRSVTNIAITVEEENNADATNVNDDKVYTKLTSRRNIHLRNALVNLIRTGGGTHKVSSGQSHSVGRAGVQSARRLASFFSSVDSIGLKNTLEKFGLDNLIGKNFKEIITYLQIYFSDSSVGMDETAASMAVSEIIKELEVLEYEGSDIKEIEGIFKENINTEKMQEIVTRFFGYYLFEHLSQRFEEKIIQKKGKEISSETFKIIKEDILGRVALLNSKRSITQIDWQGTEGKQQIESILESIIYVYTDENIN